MRNSHLVSRANHMADKFAGGLTLQQIGNEYGISRERVRQILRDYSGMSRVDGGSFIRTLIHLRYVSPKKEPKYLENYGCYLSEAIKLNEGKNISVRGGIALKYSEQRRNALTRNIAWEITFPQWVRVWEESGNFNERGRGTGYCMARIGDTGGYSVDNVEIITISQNFSDSYLKTSWKSRHPNGCDYLKKSHCVNGHERVPENLSKNYNCLICLRERKIKFKSSRHNYENIKAIIDNLGGTNAVANLCLVSRSTVSHWQNEGIPAARCVAIERATSGAVTRQDLRPNDWESIWPELAEKAA